MAGKRLDVSGEISKLVSYTHTSLATLISAIKIIHLMLTLVGSWVGSLVGWKQRGQKGSEIIFTRTVSGRLAS